MGIFERAWKSILRQPVKSLVLLFTVAILGTLIAGAVSLKQGIIATQKEMESKMKLTGTVVAKENSMLNSPLDTATIEKIATLPQVQGYEIITRTALITDRMLSKRVGSNSTLALSICGVKDGMLLDYSVGYLTLVSGRWLTPEDENSAIRAAVIPDDFARDNQLSIGSSFTLTDAENAVDYTFSVVGTFNMQDKYEVVNGVLYSFDKQFPHLDVYTSTSTAEKILEFSKKKYNESVGSIIRGYTLPGITVWLKDRQSVDTFAAAATAEGLPNEYRFDFSTQMYDNTMAPMQNLQWIVNWIIIATVVATIGVLGLVISLILKSRQLEMGILFSLGERKKRIVRQMATEILIVTVLGLTISAFAGYRLSQGIAEQMVKNEAESMVVGRARIYDANVLHSLSQGITPTLGADTFVWIYLTGLLTAGASSVLPVIITLRQSPKNILLK